MTTQDKASAKNKEPELVMIVGIDKKKDSLTAMLASCGCVFKRYKNGGGSMKWCPKHFPDISSSVFS